MRTETVFTARLKGTYRHRLTVFRPRMEGGEERIWENQPCALSRSAQVSAPQPPQVGAALPESAYRLSVFTAPEVCLRLGDRLEVTDGSRVWHGRASDSIRYPNHCITVMEVREVTEN